MQDASPLIPAIAQTALVLVDLQLFTVSHPTKPLPGQQVLANAAKLADACRATGMLVILVRAGASLGARLSPPTDQSFPPMQFVENGMDFPGRLGPMEGDVVVTKYNWGGFYCTDLDAQLRRRQVSTIILAGLMTGYGVEGTARQAHERAYAQVFVADAMSGFTVDEHQYSLTTVLPRMGRVRTVDQVIAAFPESSSGS